MHHTRGHSNEHGEQTSEDDTSGRDGRILGERQRRLRVTTAAMKAPSNTGIEIR